MAAEGKKSSQSLQFPAFEPAKLTDKQYRKMAELKLAFIEIKGHTGSMSNYTDKKCQEKRTEEARNSAKEHQKNSRSNWRRSSLPPISCTMTSPPTCSKPSRRSRPLSG